MVMPRKAGTKDKFITVNMEKKAYDNFRKTKISNEPLYQTLFRASCQWSQSELSDAQWLINDLQQQIKDMRVKINHLEAERKNVQTLERYI